MDLLRFCVLASSVLVWLGCKRQNSRKKVFADRSIPLYSWGCVCFLGQSPAEQ